MFGIDDAALMAGAGSALDFIGGMFSNSSAKSSANKAMEFQRMQDDTKHVRNVQDLRNAGLNPRLSALSGALPTAATPPTYKPENPARGLGSNAISSAVAAAQIKNLSADTILKSEQARAADAQANLTNTNAVVAAKEIPFANMKATVTQNLHDKLTSAAAAHRQRGFWNTLLTAKPSEGGAFKPIKGWAADKLGF